MTDSAAPEHIITDRLLWSGTTRRNVQHFLLERLPAFALPTDPAAWLAYAEEIRQRVLREVVYRGVPADVIAAEPAVEWRDSIETGHGYVIRKFVYEGFPGIWFPGLLYQPDMVQEPAPAVLNVNGHDHVLGKAAEAEQIRSINLAKRGIITLHPEWIACGEMRTAGLAHDKLAYLDLCGQSGLAVFYLHMRRALDILLGLPHVDSTRVAMTGLSGGGWQTIVLAALDTRITHAVPVAGYITHNRRAFYPSDAGDVEQTPNGLLTIADYDTLTALLAPRPALIIGNAYDDCCFASHRAKPTIYDPVRPLYELLGAGDIFEWYDNTDPGTHNYEQDNREAFYRFINKHLLAGDSTDDEIPCRDELLTPEQLAAGVPDGNGTFASLASALAAELPRSSDASPAARRSAIREMLRLTPDAVGDAHLLGERAVGDRHVRSWQLALASGFALPAVEYTQPETAPVALVIADGGRAASAAVVEQLWNSGHRVMACDPLFIGELALDGAVGWHQYTLAYRFAMMFASAGLPPLGMQVAQIAAAARWAASSCALTAVGPTATVAALIATAVDEEGTIGSLSTEGMPSSLRLLFEDETACGTQPTPYSAHPTLFCFGLLELTDVGELTQLCTGKEVEHRGVWVDPGKPTLI